MGNASLLGARNPHMAGNPRPSQSGQKLLKSLGDRMRAQGWPETQRKRPGEATSPSGLGLLPITSSGFSWVLRMSPEDMCSRGWGAEKGMAVIGSGTARGRGSEKTHIRRRGGPGCWRPKPGCGAQGVNVASRCTDLNPSSLFLRRQDVCKGLRAVA